MRGLATLAAALLSLAGACKRTPLAEKNGPTEVPILAAPTASITIEASRRPMFESARSGETIERVELARKEGAAGLCEALGDPTVRTLALEALGYAEGTEQLAPLCQTIKDGADGDVTRAIDAVAMIAARGEGIDVEAAPGLRCLKELVAAKPKSTPRLREAVASLEDAERQKGESNSDAGRP